MFVYCVVCVSSIFPISPFPDGPHPDLLPGGLEGRDYDSFELAAAAATAGSCWRREEAKEGVQLGQEEGGRRKGPGQVHRGERQGCRGRQEAGRNQW